MTELAIEGVTQEDLEKCIAKLDEISVWVSKEKLDRWAYRAALLKVLYDNADEYFASGDGTFREIAAFDNAVASALKKINEESKK